jgi:branched-chain amino acid transport system substrate-binding protein
MKRHPGVLLILAFLAASCSRTRSLAEERAARAAKASEIVVGAAWSWATGPIMKYADGLDMAVDEVNGGGGIDGRRLRLVKVDDNESLDQGRLIAQRLASDPDIVAVIGHLHSYVTNPAAAIYDIAGPVIVAPASTDPALTAQGYTRLFRLIFTNTQVGRQLADYAVARGYQRVAIYYVRSDYGRGLANAFEEAATHDGAQIVDRQSYDPDENLDRRSLDSTLDGWKARGLSAIFIAGEAAQAAVLVQEARARGISVPVLAGDAAGTPELFGQGADNVEGTVVASPFHPDDPRPEVSAFVRRFEARYHGRPDAAAAIGYDAVKLLAYGMATAHSAVPDRVAEALHAAQDWHGVTGTLTFTRAGDPASYSVVKMVAHRGRFEFLAESPGGVRKLAAR